MFFSAVEWLNCLMNDLKNDLMKASFSYWVKQFAVNCYLQVDALVLGNWEWCERGEGPYEIPPSCGWTCSIKNNLFLKPRESH